MALSPIGHSLKCVGCNSSIAVNEPKFLDTLVVEMFKDEHEGHEIVETAAP